MPVNQGGRRCARILQIAKDRRITIAPPSWNGANERNSVLGPTLRAVASCLPTPFGPPRTVEIILTPTRHNRSRAATISAAFPRVWLRREHLACIAAGRSPLSGSLAAHRISAELARKHTIQPPTTTVSGPIASATCPPPISVICPRHLRPAPSVTAMLRSVNDQVKHGRRSPRPWRSCCLFRFAAHELKSQQGAPGRAPQLRICQIRRNFPEPMAGLVPTTAE